MKTSRLLFFYYLTTIVMGGPVWADSPIQLPESWHARPLLKSIYASGHDLTEFFEDETQAVVFIFTSTTCPVAQQYVPTLNAMHASYASQGVRFVAAYSNTRVNLFSMARHAHDTDIHFLAMQDYEYRLADLLDVRVTPEVVVLDREMNKRYQGSIDDQFTKRGRVKQASRHYLQDALDAVLAGEKVSRPYVPPSGCVLARQPAILPQGEFTYHRDIKPILQAKCQTCHRPDHVAPFTLMDYDDVYYTADTIAEVVEERRMPPWHGSLNPKFGEFAADARLTKKEIGIIKAWVDAGAPEGDPAEGPSPIEWPDLKAWKIGQPDFIYSMPEPFEIPKTGVLDYQFFRIKMNYPEDRWVQAVELKPGNAEVVHHMTMHLVPASDKDYSSMAGMLALYGFDNEGIRMIGDYVPGDPYSAKVFEAGEALRLPKNTDLIFEMHYTPNNREATTDQSVVGLRWAKQPPAEELHSIVFRKPVGRFRIPAGDQHFKMEDIYYFKEDVEVDAIRAHFHLRGKSYRLELITRDELTGRIVKRETVFTIPAWDLDWQRTYELETPMTVLAGQELVATGHFDNSRWNPNNPSPDEDVLWGQQTDDEMFNSRFVVRKKKVSADRTVSHP